MLCPLHLFQLGCRRQIGCGEEGEGGGREGAGEDGLKEGGAEEVFVFGERAGEEVELGFVPGSSGFFGRGAGCARAGASGGGGGGGGGGRFYEDRRSPTPDGTLSLEERKEKLSRSLWDTAPVQFQGISALEAKTTGEWYAFSVICSLN